MASRSLILLAICLSLAAVVFAEQTSHHQHHGNKHHHDSKHTVKGTEEGAPNPPQTVYVPVSLPAKEAARLQSEGVAIAVPNAARAEVSPVASARAPLQPAALQGNGEVALAVDNQGAKPQATAPTAAPAAVGQAQAPPQQGQAAAVAAGGQTPQGPNQAALAAAGGQLPPVDKETVPVHLPKTVSRVVRSKGGSNVLTEVPTVWPSSWPANGVPRGSELAGPASAFVDPKVRAAKETEAAIAAIKANGQKPAEIPTTQSATKNIDGAPVVIQAMPEVKPNLATRGQNPWFPIVAGGAAMADANTAEAATKVHQEQPPASVAQHASGDVPEALTAAQATAPVAEASKAAPATGGQAPSEQYQTVLVPATLAQKTESTVSQSAVPDAIGGLGGKLGSFAKDVAKDVQQNAKDLVGAAGGNELKCKICEFVAEAMIGTYKVSKDAVAMTQKANSICAELPGPLALGKEMCVREITSKVAGMGEEVATHGETSAKQVCINVDMCPGSKSSRIGAASNDQPHMCPGMPPCCGHGICHQDTGICQCYAGFYGCDCCDQHCRRIRSRNALSPTGACVWPYTMLFQQELQEPNTPEKCQNRKAPTESEHHPIVKYDAMF